MAVNPQDPRTAQAPERAEERETVRLTPEEEAGRARRNRFIGWALAGFIILVFLVTVVRLSETAEAPPGETINAAQE